MLAVTSATALMVIRNPQMATMSARMSTSVPTELITVTNLQIVLMFPDLSNAHAKTVQPAMELHVLKSTNVKAKITAIQMLPVLI